MPIQKHCLAISEQNSIQGGPEIADNKEEYENRNRKGGVAVEISPIDSVRALGKLLDPLPQVQSEASLTVMKKTMDAQATQLLAVLNSIEPSGVGANVDFRV